MGLAPLMLFTTSLLVVHNQRILHAWNALQEQKNAGPAAGLPLKPQTPPQSTRQPRRAAINPPRPHTNCPMSARTLEGWPASGPGRLHPLPAVYLTLNRALGDLSGYWSRRASLSAGE